MRLSTLSLALVTLFTGVVNSSSQPDCTSVALNSIPSCAQPCFLNKAPDIGCGGLDFTCQCEKQAALYAAIEGCVADSCAAEEHQAVVDGAESVCKCALPSPGDTVTISGSYISQISSIPVSSIIILPSITTTTPPIITTTKPVDEAPATTAKDISFTRPAPASSNNAGQAFLVSKVGMVVSTGFVALVVLML
ncbi:hypothetical protein QBC42DRAFT_264025 [Cladorrhinum samala]|uniref:CFEM domain-containing protein n=1 Tax=Cladorrhinum samala TaxID=585594 RepID=A0AAV9HXF4_9PEZI|nr:hypothetical protein QBC42DRAFT_264025 [Cladorrhinum samala]